MKLNIVYHSTRILLLLLLIVRVCAQSAEASFSQGLQAYVAEDYERAITLFEQAAREEPSVSKYHHWLGKAAGRRAERVSFFHAPILAKKARMAFEKAVHLDPENIGALTDLLDYYLAAPSFLGGGLDKARAIADRLAKIEPAEGHRARALIFAKQKDYADAEKEYRLALQLEPNRLGRTLDLASFLSDRQRYSESDELFERAAEPDPDAPSLLFARGKALVLSNRDPQKARELLEQYLRSPRRHPDDPPPSEVRSLLKKLGP